MLPQKNTNIGPMLLIHQVFRQAEQAMRKEDTR